MAVAVMGYRSDSAGPNGKPADIRPLPDRMGPGPQVLGSSIRDRNPLDHTEFSERQNKPNTMVVASQQSRRPNIRLKRDGWKLILGEFRSQLTYIAPF